MEEFDPTLAKQLRKRIRDFEDRKISTADLANEVRHFAREIHGESESQVRRTLERHGNRLQVLAERGSPDRGELLAVVDEIVSELAALA